MNAVKSCINTGVTWQLCRKYARWTNRPTRDCKRTTARENKYKAHVAAAGIRNWNKTSVGSVSDTSESIASLDKWSDDSDIEVSRPTKRTKKSIRKKKSRRKRTIVLDTNDDSDKVSTD